MAVTCSICSKGEEAANVVNELLLKKSTLDQVAKLTGFHRSSVHRHRTGDCRFSFAAFKAAKVRDKNRPMDCGHSRLVVCWPKTNQEPRFTLFEGGDEIAGDALTAADVLLRVEYARIDPLKCPNPAALDNPATRAEAEAEDALRFPKSIA